MRRRPIERKESVRWTRWTSAEETAFVSTISTVFASERASYHESLDDIDDILHFQDTLLLHMIYEWIFTPRFHVSTCINPSSPPSPIPLFPPPTQSISIQIHSHNSSLPTPSIPTNSVSNTSVLPAGIGPIARSPYPNAGGIVNTRLSPIHISSSPSSQPLITWPLPTVKLRGWPRV